MLFYLAIAIHLECWVSIVRHILIQYSLKVHLFLFISTLLFVLLFGGRTYLLPSDSFVGMEQKTLSSIFIYLLMQLLDILSSFASTFGQSTFISTNFHPTLHYSRHFSFISSSVVINCFDTVSALQHYQ